MSLDVTLKREKWVSYDKGETYSVEFDVVYDGNITHNLNTMADEAGIYFALWRPDEIGANKASDLIEPLKIGLKTLLDNPGKFKEFNPSNGWGSYEGLCKFVESYLEKCIEYPTATIEVWR